MLRLIRRIFHRAKESTDEDRLQLQNEAQLLRLELDDREKTIIELRRQIELRRSSEKGRTEAGIRQRLEELMKELCEPVTQLVTQAHLVEVEKKPVRAEDILTVANQLVRKILKCGLKLEGKIGEKTAYDPNRHQALDAGCDIAPGDRVVVRFVGASFGGRLLNKAGVQRL